MLRAIGIGFVLLVVVLCGAAVFGYYQFDSMYGLSQAPEVDYQEVMTPNVRAALLIEPEKALAFIKGLLPANQTTLPSWLPWDAGEMLEMGTFGQAAVLIGSDAPGGKVDVTVFLNERVGGPAIASEGSKTPYFKNAAPLTWADPALTLVKRGLIKGSASLPLSPAVNATVAKYFQPSTTPIEMPLTREHLAEIYVDNTDGEILRIAGAGLEANGGSLEQVMLDENAQKMLTGIGKLRVVADITGPDQVTIQLAIIPSVNSTPETQKSFPFVLNFVAMPMLKNEAKKNGLVFDWSAPDKKAALVDGVITAEATVTGFRERLQSQINQAMGSSNTPTPTLPEPAPSS